MQLEGSRLQRPPASGRRPGADKGASLGPSVGPPLEPALVQNGGQKVARIGGQKTGNLWPENGPLVEIR